MTWQISTLKWDLKKKNASVVLIQKSSVFSTVDPCIVNLIFPIIEDIRREESSIEEALKARTKQLLIEAANSM